MIKVCIDAGHGGKDPGAVSGNTKEKDIALSISKKIRDYLVKYGISVSLTRELDVFDNVNVKAEKGNKSNADLFVSIHCNSAGNTGANGAEVLVYNNAGENKKAAESILNAIIADLGLKNRGVKVRPDLAVLRETKMTAVLVETGFISNAGDRKLLLEKQAEFAKSIGRGILEYFGVKIDEKKGENKLVEKSKIIINGKEVVVDRILIDGRNYIWIRDIASLMGYNVGNNGNIPILTKKID